MTADPSRNPDRPAAFFVVTVQGVRLGGPYGSRAQALEARAALAEGIRLSLMRERASGEQIAERVRAVVVACGGLVGPWQRFEPC